MSLFERQPLPPTRPELSHRGLRGHRESRRSFPLSGLGALGGNPAPSSLTTGKRDSIVDPMVQRSRFTPGAEMNSADQGTLRRVLAGAGCRYTPQRAAVFAFLESVKSHPTAEEVYRAVRRRIPRISLATVYNALDVLVAAGLATKLTGADGSARYDCRGEDHYHFRDVATGEIRDLPVAFDPGLLSKLDPSLVERLRGDGIEVTGYRLEVLGRAAR